MVDGIVSMLVRSILIFQWSIQFLKLGKSILVTQCFVRLLIE